MTLKSTLKALKLNESIISTILGALLIIVVGVLVINFFAKRQEGQIIPPIEIEDENALPTTHTISKGEKLWSISEKYYGTGYNWVDIAKENSISDANKISEGQVLTIPDVKPRIAEETEYPTLEPTKSLIVEVTPIPTLTPKAASTTIGYKKHIVEKGENLWKIAEKYYQSGFNFVDIAKENSISSPYKISEGLELSIPDVPSKKLTAKPLDQVSPTIEAISGASYTVNKTDNLWNIAVRAYGDGYKWVEIAKENKLVNPNVIHSGNILSLPR